MSKPLATIGIISIGQMGLGIAKLLTAHRYKVLTNVSDRSPATQARAREAQLGLVSSDVDLVSQSDYIFSIVPPRDALATASRIIDAVKVAQRGSSSALYFLDLNAISPSTVSKIASAFEDDAKDVRFVDGGIIGGPPSPVVDSSEWKKPGVPLSGPFPLHEAPVSGEDLAQVLNTRYLDGEIGSASGLKCCFAALSKGMTALALQSFTAASSLGVVPDLQFYLSQYNPEVGERVASSITGCPSKAYRWVEEMNQIGDCFAEVGGWANQAKVFREIAGVYQGLADVVEKRGGTEGMDKIEGAISALGEGLKDKK